MNGTLFGRTIEMLIDDQKEIFRCKIRKLNCLAYRERRQECWFLKLSTTITTSTLIFFIVFVEINSLVT
jgi:hypothetical protein